MTLFDTSVIIDARDPDSPFHEWAKQQIARTVAGIPQSSCPDVPFPLSTSLSALGTLTDWESARGIPQR